MKIFLNNMVRTYQHTHSLCMNALFVTQLQRMRIHTLSKHYLAATIGRKNSCLKKVLMEQLSSTDVPVQCRSHRLKLCSQSLIQLAQLRTLPDKHEQLGQLHTLPDKHERPKKKLNWEWWTLRSTKEKLLILYGGAFVAIGVTCLFNWYFYVKKTSIEERLKSRKIAVPTSRNPLYAIAAIPCMGNAVIFGIVGSFASWVATFLLTSNPKKAWTALGGSFFFLGWLFFIACRINRSSSHSDTMEDDLRKLRKNRKNDT